MKISLLFVLLSLVPICAIAQKDPDFSQSIELSGDF